MEQKSNRAGRAGHEDKYSFRNLLLWKKGQAVALQVVKMTERLPDTIAARVLARQIVAAAGSVPANIAEGHGRYSRAAYRNHLSIARGSVCEVETWIDLLARAAYIPADLAGDLAARCNEILAGLTSQMRALERKLRSDGSPRVSDDSAEYLISPELRPDD